MSEVKLLNPPTDCISSLCFSPTSSQFLLVSSWDDVVRLYDVNENNLRLHYAHTHAVLDCCFQDSVNVLSGGLDKTLKLFNCNTSTETVVGSHDAAIKCVEYCPKLNVVITGSWDSTVKLWDLRSPTPVNSFDQNKKVYTMSLCGDKLIVGTANRKVLIWDLRNTGYVQQKRESSLRYQTRCIRAFPNQQGYVLSCIEDGCIVSLIGVSYGLNLSVVNLNGASYGHVVNCSESSTVVIQKLQSLLLELTIENKQDGVHFQF